MYFFHLVANIEYEYEYSLATYFIFLSDCSNRVFPVSPEKEESLGKCQSREPRVANCAICALVITMAEFEGIHAAVGEDVDQQRELFLWKYGGDGITREDLNKEQAVS